MNKVIITKARLVKDIEVKYNVKGNAVIQNSIAIKRDYKNENGEYDTDFFNISLFGNNAEYISKFGSKGSLVNVFGALRNYKYKDKDGNNRTSTEIIVDNIELLSKATDKDEPVKEEVKEPVKATNDLYEQFADEISDDDLPF